MRRLIAAILLPSIVFAPAMTWASLRPASGLSPASERPCDAEACPVEPTAALWTSEIEAWKITPRPAPGGHFLARYHVSLRRSVADRLLTSSGSCENRTLQSQQVRWQI